MSERFQNRSTFPGTEGGPFDLVVKAWEWIESIPWPVYLSVLAALAWIFSSSTPQAVVMAGFFYLDYLLMLGLPRFRISFGPAKAPALMLALMRLPFALLPFGWNVALQAAGTALVVYGFWVEPQQLRISREQLEVQGFNPGRPLRLLHSGDLHFEHRTRREDRLLKAARDLKPDLVLFSGDFLSYSYTWDRGVWKEVNAYLREFTAPLGIFCVRGSPPVDPEEVLEAILPGTGFLRLKNHVRQLTFLGEALEVIGVDCSHNPDEDREVLSHTVEEAKAALRILLYHSPDLAPDAGEFDITLQLSGHTHGGQVRLPLFGALYAASLYGKRFESGRYRVGDMALYVSRGIGLEGKGAPRVRFLCPPEITLWEIS